MNQTKPVLAEQAKPYLDIISAACEKQKVTIATAESVTSGCLQLLFSNALNARKFFQGGITVYNGAQKTRHLNVEPIYAEGCQCVDAKVSLEMARNVCNLFCCEIGIGITGFATLVPEEHIDELTAFVAIVRQGAVLLETEIRPTDKNVQGLQVQEDYSLRVLELLAGALGK